MVSATALRPSAHAPIGAVKVKGLLADNVHHALELVLQANGQLHRRRIVPQLLPGEEQVSE